MLTLVTPSLVRMVASVVPFSSPVTVTLRPCFLISTLEGSRTLTCDTSDGSDKVVEVPTGIASFEGTEASAAVATSKTVRAKAFMPTAQINSHARPRDRGSRGLEAHFERKHA